ncbi:S8 family serine peptidase [Actinocatenispora sera]|uniref:S8 family serine peptidase n=1 Tax=Actinocatenispora sera TaxID=390989 RepID=UPI0034091437
MALGIIGLVAVPTTAHADTVRGGQWYLDYLHVPQAQQISTGAGVTVAVIDSGVDASHPDLAGHVLPGKSFGNAAGKPATRDAEGHGTSMAGIIAAQGGSAGHALGIAPNAKVLPVRTSTTATNDTHALAKAIRWATDHGADVINMSQAGNQSTPDEVSAVHYAEVHDVVLVGGAGNTDIGVDSIGAPGRLKGVLNATGTTSSGDFWTGSAQGKYATLSAPAVKIVAPCPRSACSTGYALGTGTSASAAIVSGVAALVRAKFPRMDSANVINRIIRTATDRGPKGWDQRYGFGIVNPVAALTADVPTVDQNPLGGIVADPLASSAPTPDESAASAEKSGTSNGLLIVSLTIGAVAVIVLLVIVLVIATRRGKRGTRSDTAPTGPSTTSMSVPAGGDAGGEARSAPWTGPSSSGGPGAPHGGPSLGAPPPPDEHR